jgi:C-8 sterol isomerase
MGTMGYIFDPERLHEIIKPHLSLPLPEKIEAIASDLSAAYPGHIRGARDWVFNNAGGAMGLMLVLHASITEYVIIFGSPIGTEGHTGRFFANDYFYILDGEQWTYREGQLGRDVYKPGDCNLMPAGEARGYRIPDSCWALEYARGAIPLMLPFGFADSLFSTVDFVSLGKTLKIYTHSVVRELMQGKL